MGWGRRTNPSTRNMAPNDVLGHTSSPYEPPWASGEAKIKI